MTKSTETEIELLKAHMENIEQKMDEGFEAVKLSNRETNKLIEDFIKKSEEKFAPMWAADILIWAGRVVLAILLTGIVYSGVSFIK